MSEFLVAIILAACPGYDVDEKGQAITNECQERIVNCAVGKAGKIDQASIMKCLKEEENEGQRR